MGLVEKIETIANNRGTSALALVAAAGVSPSNWYKWKKGETKPRNGSVNQLSSFLGIPASTLVSDSLSLGESVVLNHNASEAADVAENLVSADGPEGFVFVGLRRSTLNAIRSLLLRLEPNAVAIPEDVGSAVWATCSPLAISQRLTSFMRTETFGLQP